jgi:hypothetical protein
LVLARRELALESALAKLDKYHLLILDDIVYVSKDQAETSVLFELIGSRYERRSMPITANQPFGAWSNAGLDNTATTCEKPAFMWVCRSARRRRSSQLRPVRLCRQVIRTGPRRPWATKPVPVASVSPLTDI